MATPPTINLNPLTEIPHHVRVLPMYHVLYVDDEPILLAVAKLLLEETGEFSLTTVTSAVEALAIMHKVSYDAVVSDYQMPGMDGIRFLKDIRTIYEDLPFILFTGRGREDVVIEAINNGADAYLQKGGDPESEFAELSHTIKKAVARKRAADALKQDESRLETLVSSYQMVDAPLRELMTYAIENAVKITTSSIGYLAFVDEDETGMTMYAWSAEAMHQCTIREKPIRYVIASTGLWGEAVRQRSPVITNDYAAPNPQKKGYPEGHVPIIRHMNIPVFDGAHIVMVAGVGNKRSDYDERDLRELSLLMNGLWQVIKQRRAEAALRESESRLHHALEGAGEGLWDWHLPSGKAYFSSRYYTMLGYEPGEFPASFESWSSQVHPDERDAVISDLLGQIAERRPGFESEYRARTKDGDYRWIYGRGKAIEWDEEGNVTRVIGTNADITERRRAENALRQANRQLTLLSGITRHDILNKVTVILGYLGIAEQKCTDPDLGNYLKSIELATHAIQSQVEFTRVYQDLGTHEPQWQRLETILPTSQVPPTITLTADLQGVEVYTDLMLEKALFNLLDNSIRHGQHVTGIRVSSRQAGEDLMIVWEDDGAGIPLDEKEKVFIRGYGKNTGLGLFLVREILSLTGITIREAGIEGKGARFEITVPKGNYRFASGS